MPFIVSKIGRDTTLDISGEFKTPMQPGSFPVSKLKGETSIAIELDADISNTSAVTTMLNFLSRAAVTSLNIKSARGLAIALAATVPVVTIAKGGEIEFRDLPQDAENTARKTILSKLAARFNESESTIASWFAKGRKLNYAEASALFAKADGFKAKAMIGRDGKLDPKKVFARWNAARGKANA